VAKQADVPNLNTKFDIAAIQDRAPACREIGPHFQPTAEKALIGPFGESKDRHGVEPAEPKCSSRRQRQQDDGVNRSKNKRRFEPAGFFCSGICVSRDGCRRNMAAANNDGDSQDGARGGAIEAKKRLELRPHLDQHTSQRNA